MQLGAHYQERVISKSLETSKMQTKRDRAIENARIVFFLLEKAHIMSHGYGTNNVNTSMPQFLMQHPLILTCKQKLSNKILHFLLFEAVLQKMFSPGYFLIGSV